ncbi:hypothetical protein GU243_11370 [Pseudarthrobacter psychrotolerans]|uniref:Uncharacterized protein n=1 Tax=Pseudarthrobacter psychrotolerans TaxID=2697569 RepID=A0A6P1NMH3_9MICC|nr:hypothetical protein [Pseudarthrobacter psychrotolerans]QHK20233.1 hypothetical protein GU243_11370 [Pseudarthrobacter psychrotolerans]
MNTAPDHGDARIIDRLLRESNTEESDLLRPVLLELRALGTGEPPVPSPEVAAFLVPGASNVVRLDAAPRRVRRAAFTVLAVAATLGAGTAAAAATDEGFRAGLHDTVATIVTALTTGPQPSPAVPSVATSGSPTPSPAASGGPGSSTVVPPAVPGTPPGTIPHGIPSWLTPGPEASPTDPAAPHSDAPAPADQKQTHPAPSPAVPKPVLPTERKRP